ncbi:MAG TPA: sigma 54-interacting transcriptional regulator, partial [Actinomycetota bacterium]|nr:sigma 54-interacting transcriptional regulator [Actinomycetota bacterium]
DFAGLPVVIDGGVLLAPPRWAHRLASSGQGILFLDEISTAPPAVQAALLRVVLERVVGDLELPDGVVIIAAANPPEQSADGWDLSAPLANRFCHLDWTVDSSAFAQGIVGGWSAPHVPELPLGWEMHMPISRGLVSAFVSVRPSLTLAVPSDGSSMGRGWPSPRTWEMTARLWTACELAAVSDESRSALIRGALGDGAGIEFLSWTQEMDLPNPEDLLENPMSFVPPERGDRVYAVLSSVAAAVAGHPTPDRWLSGWKVLVRAGETTPDVAAVAARVLAQCRPAGVAAPPELKIFAPLLRDAGLMDR